MISLNGKKVRFLLIPIVCLVLFSFLVLPGSAASIPDEYVERSPDEMQAFLDGIEFQIYKKEPKNMQIDCFSAQWNQNYAVGHYIGGRSNCNVIDFFRSDAEYLYSISFVTRGTYDIAWDQDDLLVYFFRGDLILILSSNGQCKKLYDASQWKNADPGDLFHGCINRIGKAKVFEQNGYSYRVSTSTIKRTDPNGTTTVLYNASMFYDVAPILSIVLFFAAFIAILIKKIKMRHN